MNLAVRITYQSYPGRADRGAPTRAVWGAPHFATEGQAAFERFGAVRSLRDQFAACIECFQQTCSRLFESLHLRVVAPAFHEQKSITGEFGNVRKAIGEIQNDEH